MGRPAPQYIPEALNVERFRLVLGCSALRVPPKMGPKSVKMVPPPKKKSVPGPLGVPKHVFSGDFEAYLGPFEPPCVPQALQVEPSWDQREVKSGPKMYLSKRVLWHHCGCSNAWLQPILWPFWAVLTPCTSVGVGQKCIGTRRSNGEWSNQTKNGIC